MSMRFSVKNKKRMLFGYAPVLSVKEALELVPNLSYFGIDDSAEGFDMDKFYAARLEQLECLILGMSDISGRGFELSYDKSSQSYQVRVNTPATRADWQIALAYVKSLALKTGSQIISEREEKFSADDIEGFDYKSDIMFGLKSVAQNLDKDKDQVDISYGVVRPVAINHEIISRILAAPNPIDEYSKFMTDIQNLDAYSAKQQFYHKDESGQIIGTYVLTQELATILPFEPYVEWENSDMVQNKDITHWQIVLVGVSGDESDKESYDVLGELDYTDFITRLPKDKYRFIDASYILVEPLNIQELTALLKG